MWPCECALRGRILHEAEVDMLEQRARGTHLARAASQNVNYRKP